MKIRRSARSRKRAWRIESLSLAVLLCLAAPVARSAPRAGADADTAAEERYVSVTLNGVEMPSLARVFVRAGAVSAPASTWRELGLKIPADADRVIALRELPGASAQFDEIVQHLRIVVPVALLERAVLRLSSALETVQPAAQPAESPAFVANYDLGMQSGAGRPAFTGWSEMRLIGVLPGVLASSFLAHGGAGRGVERLDTSLQIDDAARMLTWTAGDTTTSATAWSRPVRIGGIRLSRNFALQPYRTSAPLDVFRGEALLPSTVDLYIDGMRRSTYKVAPGEFAIEGPPSLTGAGHAQVVVTDLLGRRSVLDYDVYGAPALLAPGLVDWSVEAGRVRLGWGTSASRYTGGAVASGSVRWGLDGATTLEAHAELSQDLKVLGAGVVRKLGARGGVLSLSVMSGRDHEAHGTQRSIAYQFASRGFSFAAQALRRSRGMRDLGSAFERGQLLGSESLFASMRVPLGAAGFGLARQMRSGEAATRVANLYWSIDLPKSATMTLSVQQESGAVDRRSASLTFSMPFDERGHLSSTLTATAGGETALTAQASQPANAAGWGWFAQAQGGREPAGMAQLTHEGTAGDTRLGAFARAGGRTDLFAGASGALVWMDGSVRAARRIDDAFAIVSTSGEPGIPVRLEQRLVGHTDAGGRLLVPQLNAMQRNRIEIDTLALGPDVVADRVTAEAVPPRRGGTVVDFALRRVRAVQLVLQDAHGNVLAAGTRVQFASPAPGDRQPTVVGFDGLVYLEDAQPGTELEAGPPQQRCRAIVPAQAELSSEIPRVTCR